MPKALPGGQAANQNAWWLTTQVGDGAAIGSDVVLHDFTPPTMGPRQSEGLIKADDLINRQDLYIVYPTQNAAMQSVLGRKAAAAYAKGPNDALGTAGWANDYYDIADNTRWPVLMNTPAHVEGVTHYYMPVNGGKFNYAEFSLSRDVAAVQARKAAAKMIETGPGGGMPGLGGGSPYITGGPSQTGGGVHKPRAAMELTMLRDGRFFYATNKHESGGQDSPHTGVIAAGPAMWPPSFGKPEDQGLPEGVYLLSVAPYDASPEDAAVDSDNDGVPDVIVPASKAYKSLLMACNAGDQGALEAANALEIEVHQDSRNWLKDLFR